METQSAGARGGHGAWEHVVLHSVLVSRKSTWAIDKLAGVLTQVLMRVSTACEGDVAGNFPCRCLDKIPGKRSRLSYWLCKSCGNTFLDYALLLLYVVVCDCWLVEVHREGKGVGFWL